MIPKGIYLPEPAMLGTLQNDRYHLYSSLGKKAGRQTFLAQDTQQNQLVVIKQLTFGPDFHWDDLKLFEREATTLRSLDHPAIPRYQDFFDISHQGHQGFALVQTYIEAQSLEAQVKAGRRFSETDLKNLAEQLLEILDYLHHCQPPVIHRDIKPSNILLTEANPEGPGQLYLVDFGSVQNLAAREGSTITVVGTYGYMPPEQFGGRTSPASDLYSLGATLIYLASGHHPADIPQGDDLRLNFESLTRLSRDFTGWIRSLTHPSPKQRPDSAQTALQTLRYPPDQQQFPITSRQQQTLIPKPLDSKINFQRTAQTLRVRIRTSLVESEKPHRKRKFPILKTCVGTFFFMALALWLNPPFFFVWLVLLILGLGSLGSLALFVALIVPLLSLLAETEIQIDAQYLTIDRGYGYLLNRYLQIPKHEISELNQIELPRSRHNRILVVAATMRCYILLPRDGALWLGSELSHFLDMPIDHKYAFDSSK
jgi:serine/threonine protein kinase